MRGRGHLRRRKTSGDRFRITRRCSRRHATAPCPGLLGALTRHGGGGGGWGLVGWVFVVGLVVCGCFGCLVWGCWVLGWECQVSQLTSGQASRPIPVEPSAGPMPPKDPEQKKTTPNLPPTPHTFLDESPAVATPVDSSTWPVLWVSPRTMPRPPGNGDRRDRAILSPWRERDERLISVLTRRLRAGLGSWTAEIEAWPAGPYLGVLRRGYRCGPAICRTENVPRSHPGVAALVNCSSCEAPLEGDRRNRSSAVQGQDHYKQPGGVRRPSAPGPCRHPGSLA